MRGLALLLALTAPAGAVMPSAGARADARRFGLDKPPKPAPAPEPGTLRAAVAAFNRDHRGRWNLRFGPKGVGPGAPAAARLSAMDLARTFMSEHARELGLKPEELQLQLARSNAGTHHLLYGQVVNGLPVEFASVKAHLAEDGSLAGFSSSFRSDVTASPVPVVTEEAAASRVAADLGAAAPTGGQLVYLPPPAGGAPKLAWKFQARAGGGRWVYYVDARDGSILLRYDSLEYASCVTSGTVMGLVYDVDPNQQNVTGSPVARPFQHQKVYVVDGSTYALTDANGFFCSQTSGKVHTLLEGPYCSVADFNGPSARYDNGGGVWQTFSTPLDSAHPYAPNSVSYSTINAPAGAAELMTKFDSLDVGQYTLNNGDITINLDDKVAVVDGDGNPVAEYFGQRSLLRTAAVPGGRLVLRLQSTPSTQSHNGFTVSVSSYLVLTNSPTTPNNATSTFTWSRTMTFDGTIDEPNLFYHVNAMHDYFRNGVDANDSAPIDRVMPVMARVGPALANAFYDPVHQDITVGDFNGGASGDSKFALDATVIHHEYTHSVVDTIFPIVNIGEYGALSEAWADYFSASSLGDPAIGKYVGGAFGEASLRDLDCAASPPCELYPANWSGEIHDDSRMVSQALWEIRSTAGQACADGLAFNALFYFPDSFSDFEQAMVDVSDHAQTVVPACGLNGAQDGLIESKFSNHGIALSRGDADPYDPNNGITSATDITTSPVISARIYPNADQDYYAFGAAPGPVTITLTLPASQTDPGVFTAYGLNLINSRYQIVATASPRVDVNPTLAGNCPDTNCETTQRVVTLNYQKSTPGELYVLVSALPSDSGFISNTNSTAFYQLAASFIPGSVGATIVSAQFDHDQIDFSVPVSTFVTGQLYQFHHARLLDQSDNALQGTETNAVAPWLVLVSSTSSLGSVSGVVHLAPGFSGRFPAVGNVYLEVFGVDPLGHVQSLGTSQALTLTGGGANLTAYNNLFDPLRGQKATIKWTTAGFGHVRLRLYTMAGHLVSTLVDEDRPAGEGSVDWYGQNSAGSVVASGVYLLHIEAPGISDTKKIVVVK